LAYLVDTNILLRLAAQNDPLHLLSRRAIEVLRGHGLCAASQNFVEFWNVATRPVEKNGMGQSIGEADEVLRNLEEGFQLLPETLEAYGHWRHLIMRFGVSGSKVYDARLVAVMLANDISQILTFNIADFRRYQVLGIRAVDPGEV
jgi:predicted nucleic acid-binding protein